MRARPVSGRSTHDCWLPLLIGIFGFAALQAVILNKAMSLIVVLTALPARLCAVPYGDLAPHWSVVVNLLAASEGGFGAIPGTCSSGPCRALSSEHFSGQDCRVGWTSLWRAGCSGRCSQR